MNARTAAAADSALAGMSGGIGAAVAAMRSDAVNLLAELEVSRLIEASVLIDQDFPAKFRTLVVARCVSDLISSVGCVTVDGPVQLFNVVFWKRCPVGHEGNRPCGVSPLENVTMAFIWPLLFRSVEVSGLCVQARIDFDEDLPPMDAQLLGRRLAELSEKVSSALDTAQRGRLLSTGLQVKFSPATPVSTSSQTYSWGSTAPSCLLNSSLSTGWQISWDGCN